LSGESSRSSAVSRRSATATSPLEVPCKARSRLLDESPAASPVRCGLAVVIITERSARHLIHRSLSWSGPDVRKLALLSRIECPICPALLPRHRATANVHNGREDGEQSREDGEQSFRHAACFRGFAVVWA
jgi:hypothetical protein